MNQAKLIILLETTLSRPFEDIEETAAVVEDDNSRSIVLKFFSTANLTCRTFPRFRVDWIALSLSSTKRRCASSSRPVLCPIMYNGHITEALFGLGRVEIKSIIVLTRRCFVTVGFLDADEDDEDEDVVDEFDADDDVEALEEKYDDVGMEQV